MANSRKRNRLTKREKALNASVKKDLQEKGIIPPNKPRLNRKRFAEETMAEWRKEDHLRNDYLMQAIMFMILDTKIFPVRPENVGVLKVLKIAMAIRRFEEGLPEGETSYKILDLYKEVVKPIIDL